MPPRAKPVRKANLRTTGRAPSDAATYVALLRAINVGGNNRLPMADLTAIFAEAGCGNVRTYIQSGNVAFTASARCAQQLPRVVSDMIAKEHGFRAPVILRTADELALAIESNPFLADGADPATLHIAFLAEVPGPGRAAALDPHRSPGDSFHLRGRDLYLHFPNGVARTKITNAYLDAALATTSTVRNWRTTLALMELARQAGVRS